MRDLINLINFLSEGAVGLSAGEISKYNWRFDKFIEKISNQEPFTTVDGKEILLEPIEAERFLALKDENKFTGILKAQIQGSTETIPLSKLAKTLEFGGAAVSAGQDPSEGGKEGLIVKPSQIGITDKDIPATDFYELLENNVSLQGTDYGKVIIDLATYIISGEYVMLPKEYQGKTKEKVRKAIVDYAGEYLGVLALLYGRSRFPRKAQFIEWLGADISELILNFPSKANTNLADSYATVRSTKNKHTLNISSKGTGGGAAPAISGLKMPEHIKSNPSYSDAVKFIDICQNQGTLQQAFSAMDLIFKANKDAIDKKWHEFLPFAQKNPKLMDYAKESIDSRKLKTQLQIPAKYRKLIKGVDGAGTEGGKLVYSIKKEVADAINNKDGLPEFKDAVLEILEMNFIQQYCDYKGGMLQFATQWPAKLDGKISVENKSSTSEPTAGGFSFKLGRTDASVSGNPNEPEVDDLDDTDTEPGLQKRFTKAASDIIDEPDFTPKAKPARKVGDVGRKKRA